MRAHDLTPIEVDTDEFTIGNTTVSSFDSFKAKNKIINGNFDIWQRGTNQTSSGYGSADRWLSGNLGTTTRLLTFQATADAEL